MSLNPAAVAYRRSVEGRITGPVAAVSGSPIALGRHEIKLQP
jgi:hypothetical protein